MWRLTKAMAEMKWEHCTKRWNWSSCTKLALSECWTHDLIAQSVRADFRFLSGFQWSWVQIPLRPISITTSKNPLVVNTIHIYVYISIYKSRNYFDILTKIFKYIILSSVVMPRTARLKFKSKFCWCSPDKMNWKGTLIRR